MTKREAAIVSAYTGYLIGEFSDFQAYVEEIMGRPIFTHELPMITDELKEASKKDFMSIKVKDEPPEWIYHIPMEDRCVIDFKAVEKALGFRLFGWQKDYILSGCAYAGRRTGKTTAEILHQLLSVNEEPIDFTRPARNNQAYIFKMGCHDIWEKLRDAEIEMRPVFWSKEDKKKYELTIKERIVEREQKEKNLCPTCVHDNNGRYNFTCSCCKDFDHYEKKGE